MKRSNPYWSQELVDLISGTDYRDCLFNDVEICLLQIHKEYLWDYCKEFERERKKQHPSTFTLREIL